MEVCLPKIVSAGIYSTDRAVKHLSITKNRKTAMFELELATCAGGASYVNDESAPITPALLICAKPGQTRHTLLPYECHYVHMTVEKGDLYNLLSHLPTFMQTEKHNAYATLFRRIAKYAEGAEGAGELMLQSALLELVYSLYRDFQKSGGGKEKPNNRHAIEKTLLYVKENLTGDLSLAAVSAAMGFSPIYFHNLFKASTGETLRQYVEDRRIKHAANLLISTDKPLTEIAYESGFSSQSYFSAAFKRKMGVTPREYAQSVFDRYEAEY